MAKEVTKRASEEIEPAREYSPAVLAIVDRARATGRYSELNPFMLSALSALTLEEATETGEVLGAREHVLGERLRIVGVTFLPSDPDLDSNLPLFMVLDVYREMTGERVKVSTGAEQPIGVLIRACELDWFPFDAELVLVSLGKAKTAINLKLAPTRVDTITDPL